jgi:hypothetical protein
MEKGGEAASIRVTYLVIREADKSGTSNRRRRQIYLTLNSKRGSGNVVMLTIPENVDSRALTN